MYLDPPEPPRFIFESPVFEYGAILRQDPSWPVPAQLDSLQGNWMFDPVFSTMPKGYVAFATDETLKSASLLFDNIILFHVSKCRNMWNNPLDNDAPYLPIYSGVKFVLHQIRNPHFKRDSIKDFFDGPQNKKGKSKLEKIHLNSLSKISDKFNQSAIRNHLNFVPFWNKAIELDFLIPTTSSISSVSALIDNVPQLDSKNTSWEIIKELKKDEESITKCRRMRHWLSNTASEMNYAQAQDSILLGIEEYRASLEKHGAAYKDGFFEIFLKSENITRTILSALAGKMLTDTPEGIIAGAIPIASDIILHIREYKREKKEIENHPFAYISSLERKIKVQ